MVFERWKLSTEELEGASKLLHEEAFIRTATQQPWPKLQRVLIAPRIQELLGYCLAVTRIEDGRFAEIEYCLHKLALPASELNPPPLITGDDIKKLRIPPGPAYRELLESVRDAQLTRTVTTRDEALALVAHLQELNTEP